MKSNVIIIGAGAAGMMCAIEAGKRGRKVILIDHAKTPGEKIRISGGGRCNFTNKNISKENFISSNQNFCISALKKYTAQDFTNLVTSKGISWREKTLGQLFCDTSSLNIIEMLTTELKKAKVKLSLNTNVSSIEHNGNDYILETSIGRLLSENIVIATGGKSIPKIGATDFGYRIAKQFEVGLIETRPALVALTFNQIDLDKISGLSGNSVFAEVTCNRASFSEGLLFTHRGLSGPSILQISSYWKEREDIIINLRKDSSIKELLATLRKTNGKISIKNALAFYLPTKIAEMIVREVALDGNLGDQSNLALERISLAVHHWKVKPIGSEGYRTAEVTLGGINTDELDSRTMEVKKTKGLFFIGEVVDVTGWLGGYNFQWAWSSGWSAGQVV
ncbi:MAG: putative Rossmann fold flavoprotein [Paracoccaceae bacterium]|jgi:predicted Rossmann fold flavoprotein